MMDTSTIAALSAGGFCLGVMILGFWYFWDVFKGNAGYPSKPKSKPEADEPYIGVDGHFDDVSSNPNEPD